MTKIMTWTEAKNVGVVRYFTGKPCKYGHVAERKTASGNCIECLKTVHYVAAQEEKRRYGRRHAEVKRTRERTGVNRLKHLARCAVRNAIVTGTLSALPCQRCGITTKVHAHHDDYSKPLKVTWLCPTHHAQRHRELKEEGWRE